MTLEALRGHAGAPSAPALHEARPHPGQVQAAAHLRALLAESEIRESHREGDAQGAGRLQPALHAAGPRRGARRARRRCGASLEVEINAATDNPLVFPETGEVISGGNFHGQPVALALDVAAHRRLPSSAAISERRVEQLVNPDLSGGLPPFLAADAGPQLGLHDRAGDGRRAGAPRTRSSAHPAAVDSIPTSAGREDHVSMGMTAALKLRRMVDESRAKILAIELVCAAQGLEYRKPLRPGRGVARAYERLRHLVAPLAGDRPLAPDIAMAAAAVGAGAFDF